MAIPYAWADAFVERGWARKGALSPAALRLVFVLGSFMNSRTFEAWPSIDTLKTLTNMSEGSVIAGLAELRAAGLLDVATRTKQGRHRPYNLTVYSLCRELPQNSEAYSATTAQEPEESSESRAHGTKELTGYGELTTRATTELTTNTVQFAPVEERDTATAGTENGEQAKNLDNDLRVLINEWVRNHPGDQSLEQRAHDCSRDLQGEGVRHRGVPPWTDLVLEIMRQEAASG